MFFDTALPAIIGVSQKSVLICEKKKSLESVEIHGLLDFSQTENRFEALLSRAREEGRRDGRIEGLKEMDDAWRNLDVPQKLKDSLTAPITDRLYSLRKEHNQR